MIRQRIKALAAGTIGAIGRPGAGLRCLVYHSVTEDEAPDAWQMTISRELFATQMAYLRRSGHKIVSLREGLDRLVQDGPSERLVSVTFDDGYEDFYRVAAPILERYAIPATVFLIADTLVRSEDVQNPWPGRYLTLSQIHELQRSGSMDVGCHGSRHLALRGLGRDDLHRETTVAKQIMERALGRPVDLFAYPFGAPNAVDRQAAAAVADAGFKAAFTSIFGVNTRLNDALHLRRCRVSWENDLDSFKDLLDGRYDWYAVWQIISSTRPVPSN